MITKIKVDGKEHVAIVFDETSDMDVAIGCKIALCDLIGGILAYDEDYKVSRETLADCNTLLMQMRTAPEDMYNYYNFYCGNDAAKRTETWKQCEICQ